MLSNRTSRVYCDAYELDGLMAALERRARGAADAAEARYWTGMHHAVWLLSTRSLRDQEEFFAAASAMDMDRIYYRKD